MRLSWHSSLVLRVASSLLSPSFFSSVVVTPPRKREGSQGGGSWFAAVSQDGKFVTHAGAQVAQVQIEIAFEVL